MSKPRALIITYNGSYHQPVLLVELCSITFAQRSHVSNLLLTNARLFLLHLFICAAAGFGSKSKYLFGNIGMYIKLVPGYSAGTVTSFYVSDDSPGI
jgi:hypothetical protein